MATRNDLVGQVFGKLTIVRDAGRCPKQNILWESVCSCGSGKGRIGAASDYRSGKLQSCGCLMGVKRRTHGLSRSSTYNIWCAMKDRCLNPDNESFYRYGGRGIKVCARWLVFENFLGDMGERPEGLSLDRFPNNDGNYEPDNCRWATMKEQANNTRRSKFTDAQRAAIAIDTRPRGIVAEQFGTTVGYVSLLRTQWRKHQKGA